MMCRLHILVIESACVGIMEDHIVMACEGRCESSCFCYEGCRWRSLTLQWEYWWYYIVQHSDYGGENMS